MVPSSHNLTPPKAALYPAPTHPGNPFLAAQEEWDRRTGTQWQWIKRLLTVLVIQAGAMVLLAVYAWVAPGKVEYRPHVMAIKEGEQLLSVGIVPVGWSGETKAPIDFVIRDWLSDVRTIPDSRVMWGKQWDRAKAFMTMKVQQKIASSGYARDRDEMQKMGQVVDIEITSVLPTTGEWQLLTVEWTEKTYSQQGVLIRPPELWKANLQVAIFPVDPHGIKTPKQFRNTLGIFVTGYQWGLKTTGKPQLVPQGRG